MHQARNADNTKHFRAVLPHCDAANHPSLAAAADKQRRSRHPKQLPTCAALICGILLLILEDPHAARKWVATKADGDGAVALAARALRSIISWADAARSSSE